MNLLEEVALEVVVGWQPFELRRPTEDWLGPKRGVRSSSGLATLWATLTDRELVGSEA